MLPAPVRRFVEGKLLDLATAAVLLGYGWVVKGGSAAVAFASHPGKVASPVGSANLPQWLKAAVVALTPVVAWLVAHQAVIVPLLPADWQATATTILGVLAVVLGGSAGAYTVAKVAKSYQHGR